MKIAYKTLKHTAKIFVFPFAGGNESSYNQIFDDLENVIVYNYPGRNNRIKENPIVDIHKLVEDLYPLILNALNGLNTYYIYGHSLGAMVAFLIAKRIGQDPTLLQPKKLVVTGFRPPSISREKFSHLSETAFWDRIISFGGVPIEMIEQPILQKFFEPILRSDIKLWESYDYIETNQLSIPIHAFYGSDEKTTYNEMCLWKKESSSEVLITEFKGGHFFILDHLNFFKDYFKNLIRI